MKKNIFEKILLKEQEHPPGADWELICTDTNSDKENKKKVYTDQGCVVEKGRTTSGKDAWFYKKPCPPTETPASDWRTEEIRKCIASAAFDLEDVGNDIVGYFDKGTEEELKITFKGDGTEEWEYKEDGRIEKGFWKCEDGKMIQACCDTKNVCMWNGTKYEWKDDEAKTIEMGCTPATTPTPSTTWDRNCSSNDLYKKNCWDGEIRRLQKCLNKKIETTLPDLVIDGKWGKKTQEKIEELYPTLKDGVSEDQITEICQSTSIKKDEEKPKDEPIVVDKGEEEPEEIVWKVIENLTRKVKQKLSEKEIKNKRLKRLISEQVADELVQYAMNYIDSNDCPKIKADMEKYRNSGAITDANDLREMDSGIGKLNLAIAVGACPKNKMKKEFNDMAQKEPEKLKNYMCWFSKNISVPSTPLAACNESTNVTTNKAEDKTNQTVDDKSNVSTNTNKDKSSENMGDNNKTKNRVEGDLSFLSDEEFFQLALVTYKCLPTYPNPGAWLEMPKLSENKGKKALIGKSMETGETYAFYRDFTAENFNTGAKAKWYCSALRNYAPKKFRPNQILQKFGVDPNIETERELSLSLNRVTRVLQGYVDARSVSDDIMQWKNMLDTYYSTTQGVDKITLPNDKDIYLPNVDDLELGYYPSENLERYGFTGVKIYQPKRTQKLSVEGPLTGQDPQSCISYLKTYLMHAIARAGGIENESMSKLEMYRASIINCSNAGAYQGLVLRREEVLDPKYFGNMKRTPFDKYGRDFEWRDIVEFLKGETTTEPYDGKRLKLPSPYAVTLQEHRLKSQIKSTLTEMVLNKKRKLVEGDLIKSRVSVLLENSDFTTLEEKRLFVINLVREAVFVDSLTSDKKLIKEEFWDALKAFFGSDGSESVFRSFKKRMGEWMTSHLSPKKADGWIGSCIRKTIQDIDMRDVHKITDCKFLTKQIAQSVIEKLDEKMSNDELKDEGLYDIVRGGMADNVKSARFKEHIEDKVSKMICPILYNMSNKFDSMFDGMKKRAVGL